jgi:hypothetical protein
MRPSSVGIQFFDLVEDSWISDFDSASSAATSSGYTAGAITATRTVARRAATRAERGQLARRAGNTGPATRAEPITVTSSVPTAPASESAAWGIMVPKS